MRGTFGGKLPFSVFIILSIFIIPQSLRCRAKGKHINESVYAASEKHDLPTTSLAEFGAVVMLIINII